MKDQRQRKSRQDLFRERHPELARQLNSAEAKAGLKELSKKIEGAVRTARETCPEKNWDYNMLINI